MSLEAISLIESLWGLDERERRGLRGALGFLLNRNPALARRVVDFLLHPETIACIQNLKSQGKKISMLSDLNHFQLTIVGNMIIYIPDEKLGLLPRITVSPSLYPSIPHYVMYGLARSLEEAKRYLLSLISNYALSPDFAKRLEESLQVLDYLLPAIFETVSPEVAVGYFPYDFEFSAEALERLWDYAREGIDILPPLATRLRTEERVDKLFSTSIRVLKRHGIELKTPCEVFAGRHLVEYKPYNVGLRGTVTNNSKAISNVHRIGIYVPPQKLKSLPLFWTIIPKQYLETNATRYIIEFVVPQKDSFELDRFLEHFNNIKEEALDLMKVFFPELTKRDLEHALNWALGRFTSLVEELEQS